MDIAAPIFNGRAGVARVGLSEARIASTVQTITAQLLLATAIVSVLGIAAAYLLTLVLTHPILQLVRVARDIEQGDLTRRAQVWSSDEIGRLSQALNAMVSRLETVQRDLVQRNEELRQKDALRGHLLQRVITAQEEERRRIARELHDETSQALTSVMVGLRLLSEEPSLEGSRNRAAELRNTVGAALDAVHHVLFELRPSMLDDNGLAAALQRYTWEYARKHSISVDFQTGNVEGLRLPSQIELTAYRIVQEALTNVARHAHARNVSLLLDRRGERLIAVVEDDGRGFDLAAVTSSQESERSLGLAGMQERAALVGGTLSIESTPGSGTALFVTLPLTLGGSGTAA
jgi:signal transduction histidine kinase